MIGFLLSPLAERYSRHRVLLTTCALLPPTLILYAASPSLWVAIVLIMVLGGLYLSLLSGLSTVVQLRTPSALRGRVMSLNSATLSTCFPLGSIGQGVLADHFGQRAVTTGAALILALILLIARLRRWHIGLVNVERWELLPGR